MELKKILNNKVVKAGSWYTITEFFLKGITFLTIPIFTRLLTTSDYGLVSLYTTWVGIFTIIIGLNLNTSITKGKYDFKQDYDKFVSSVIFLSLLVFIGFIVIFIMFGNEMQAITGFSGFIFYFMLFQAYFAFIRTSLIAKLRVEYKYKKISIISILISVFGVILSIGLITYLFQEQPYLGKIIGNGILVIIFGIVFLVYLLKNGSGNLINTKYWRYALFLSIPLIFHSLSSLVNAQFDRIIINQYVGKSATGLYSFAYNVGMIMTVLTHALDQAWSPYVYETMEAGNIKDLKSKGKVYRDFYTIAYAMLLLLSPELIKIMVNESYWESLVIVPYIFASYYLSYMYTLEVKTEFFYKKTNLISVGTIISALINVVLNIIFVPIFGYIAAAITTTISYLFLFLFHYFITSKVIKQPIYGFKFHVKSILYMLVITGYYMIFVEVLFMRIIGILLILAIGYWLLKSKIIKSMEDN
jgi:O-antigen/teichoic acid export membrane protein